jgi:hypothetical protein
MLLAAAVLLPQLVGGPQKDAVRLLVPGVEYRTNVASATRRPWVNANGWRLDREAGKVFYYDAPGDAAALAAAEAFAHNSEASIHTDQPGTVAFGKMLAFLKTLAPGPQEVLPDLGVIDDRSPASGEVINLIARLNYQIRFLTAAVPITVDPKVPVTVDPKGKLAQIGSFLQEIREKVPDKKRIVRLFGSDVVLARVTGDREHVRVHLLNYGIKPVESIRVHVAGHFERGLALAAGAGEIKLEDFDAGNDATEFTLPSIGIYAVIDLFPK